MLDTIIVDGPHPLASKNQQIVLENSLNNSGEIGRKKIDEKKLWEKSGIQVFQKQHKSFWQIFSLFHSFENKSWRILKCPQKE